MKLWLFLLLPFGVAAQNVALHWSLPGYAEGIYTIKSFHFHSGEVLPELHLSYGTVGTPLRDAAGRVRNAVLNVTWYRRGPPFSIPAERLREFSLQGK
jgi:homoserine O-acetyltransferase